MSLRFTRPELRFIGTVLRFIRKNSDYRGNFTIGGSEKSSVNGLYRFYYSPFRLVAANHERGAPNFGFTYKTYKVT